MSFAWRHKQPNLKFWGILIKLSTMNASCVFFNQSAMKLTNPRQQDNRRFMGKPTICIGENKGADQLLSNCEAVAKLISAFVIATRIVQFLYFLNPKFQASNHLLCLYSCRTCSETTSLVFSRDGSYMILLKSD